MKNYTYTKRFAAVATAFAIAHLLFPQPARTILLLVAFFAGCLAIACGFFEFLCNLFQPKDEHDHAHKSHLR